MPDIKGYGPTQNGFHASDVAKKADTAYAGVQTTQLIFTTVLADGEYLTETKLGH